MLDVLFLISILAGAAVTLGLGAPIITQNLSHLLGIEVNFGLTITVTIIWVFLFSLSAYLGIEKGIKRLSTFNMYLAAIFALFILIGGPGVFILNYFSDSVSFLLANYLNISLNTQSVHQGQPHISKVIPCFGMLTVLHGLCSTVYLPLKFQEAERLRK